MSDSTVSLPLQPEATQFVDGECDFGAFTTLQGRFVGVGPSKPFRTPKRHLAMYTCTSNSIRKMRFENQSPVAPLCLGFLVCGLSLEAE